MTRQVFKPLLFAISLTLSILLIAEAHAADSGYRICDIRQGKLHSCKTVKFTGEAIVPLSSEVDGPYCPGEGEWLDGHPMWTTNHFGACKISVGEVSGACRPHTGNAVKLDHRKRRYYACKVKAGYVVTCQATAFTGEAILFR